MLFPALHNAGEPTGHVHKAVGAAHCHKVVGNVADELFVLQMRLLGREKRGAPPRGARLREKPTADAPLGGIAAIGCLCVRLEEVHSVEDTSCRVCGRIEFSNEGHPRRKMETL